MVARKYEISLRVLKNISRVSAAQFQHEKRNFVSPSDHVIFFVLHKIHKCLRARENTTS